MGPWFSSSLGGRQSSGRWCGTGRTVVFEEHFTTFDVNSHGVNSFTSTQPEFLVGEVSKQDKVCNVKHVAV